MTYSILSIVANTVSQSGCSAYTYSLGSFQPYTRAPWYQFSEQLIDAVSSILSTATSVKMLTPSHQFAENGGTNPAFPFLTGHGGFHQIGPFGWLGLRTDGPMLLIDPALPPQIPQIALRTFYYGGATLKAFLNYTHTTITRLPTTNTYVHDVYGAGPMPLGVGARKQDNYTLSINQTITIPNREYFSNLTQPHNLLQCRPVTSDASWVPGQFPLAAVDGATSTRWQPATPDKASLTIDLSQVSIQPVIGLTFNWGPAPPDRADVLLSNSSNFEGVGTAHIPIEDITISRAYVADDTEVKVYTGNTTNIAISNREQVWSGRYAKLVIEGTQGEDDESGATVAEFGIIGVGGTLMAKRWSSVEAYRR